VFLNFALVPRPLCQVLCATLSCATPLFFLFFSCARFLIFNFFFFFFLENIFFCTVVAIERRKKSRRPGTKGPGTKSTWHKSTWHKGALMRELPYCILFIGTLCDASIFRGLRNQIYSIRVGRISCSVLTVRWNPRHQLFNCNCNHFVFVPSPLCQVLCATSFCATPTLFFFFFLVLVLIFFFFFFKKNFEKNNFLDGGIG
jgi:hypothetical protein